MDFKKDALKMLDEMSGIETKKVDIPELVETIDVKSNVDNNIDIDNILENLDQEIDNIQTEMSIEQDFNKVEPVKLVEEFKPRFLGKLYESPNPMEYPEGTMYKNTRNGIVYIKEGDSWEFLVEDGKPGAQGKQGIAGSGVGVSEVQNIATELITSATNASINSTKDQITYISGQAGWSQRILFAKHLSGANFTSTSEIAFVASAVGSQQIDGNYPGSLYKIPPIIRANFIESQSRWIKSHFMFGINMGSTSGVTFTINEYWNNVQMNSVTINYNDFQSPPTSAQNFPLELYSMYNWYSGPNTSAIFRVHNYYIAYNNAGTTGIVKVREKFPYPVIDLTQDQIITWKGSWSSTSGGSKTYIDFLQYTS